MLDYLGLSTGGEGASRILGQMEGIGLAEEPVSVIISEYLLVGAHLRICDITRRKWWIHPVSMIN